ncbi:MAG: phosphotransferase [Microbacterium sp.]
MSSRIQWEEVDARLRAETERMLGSTVVEAASQPGGFSPGSADRVLLADGRRVFVKTGSTADNPDIVQFHRREAEIAARLDRSLPVPSFVGVVDLKDRIALALEDVAGRAPTTPWRSEELLATLDAFATIGRTRAPEIAALGDMRNAGATYGAGWSRLANELPELPALPDDLGEWVTANRTVLTRRGAEMADASAGDRLVHLDARADNILIRPDGSVTVVDWPWAARGAGWIDALALLFNVRVSDATADVEAIVQEHPVFEAMPAEHADSVLAGFAGHFLFVSQGPPVPGIPTLRAFQFEQSVAILRWLRERLSRGQRSRRQPDARSQSR